MPHLTISRGEVLEGVVFLPERPVVIGRAEGVDVQLLDAHISRRHAVIRPSVAGFVIEDLGTKNGTVVNDAEVRTALLFHGDTVTLGHYLLRFVDEEHNALDSRFAVTAPVPAAGGELLHPEPDMDPAMHRHRTPDSMANSGIEDDHSRTPGTERVPVLDEQDLGESASFPAIELSGVAEASASSGGIDPLPSLEIVLPDLSGDANSSEWKLGSNPRHSVATPIRFGGRSQAESGSFPAFEGSHDGPAASGPTPSIDLSYDDDIGDDMTIPLPPSQRRPQAPSNIPAGDPVPAAPRQLGPERWQQPRRGSQGGVAPPSPGRRHAAPPPAPEPRRRDPMSELDLSPPQNRTDPQQRMLRQQQQAPWENDEPEGSSVDVQFDAGHEDKPSRWGRRKK